MKGFNGNTTITKNGGLTLLSTNKIPLLRIYPNGRMERYPGIEFALDDTITSNLLGIKLLSNGAQIGYIGIKFSTDSLGVVSSA